MITNIYLLIYFIIIIISYCLNKKYINLFFFKLIVITFLTNDLLRIVTIDLNKNLFIFIFKDIILTIFFVISIISFFKGKKVNFLNKKIIFFLLMSLLTIIFSYNLSVSTINIAKFISGSYDLLFYPLFILVIILLVKKSLDFDKLEKFFLGLNALLLSILLIQFFDHHLFVQFILNNFDPYNTEEILRIKILMFQGKYTTGENNGLDIIVPSIVFSNPGRYGHYILANFLINIFFFIRKKNYTNICSLLISFFLVVFSSQRASIYL